jgi:xanthine dehydrogenase YagS FAD-binding subunit
MMPFGFERAANEEEALVAVARGARCIAGGTTLIDLMREEVERPARLVDINALPWRDIRLREGELSIGALARMAEVAEHPEVCRSQPLIAEALLEGASPQLRNMATIGGNLLQRTRCPYFRMLDARCNKREPDSGCAALQGENAALAILGASEHCAAVHPSDLAVALVALDATVRVRNVQGERSFAVEQLFLLPEDTPQHEHALQAGELIVEVRVPDGPYARQARYLKVRDRASYEFAVVSVAAALHVDAGSILEARLAAGGVATRPWRLRECEQALRGRRAERASFEAAARLACQHARSLAGNHFKMPLLERCVVRALELAGEAR